VLSQGQATHALGGHGGEEAITQVLGGHSSQLQSELRRRWAEALAAVGDVVFQRAEDWLAAR
jgi:hypothetical protein